MNINLKNNNQGDGKAIFYFRFILRPISELLIQQKIEGAIARCYSIGKNPDELIDKVKHEITKRGEWRIDQLEVVQKITNDSFDESEHDTKMISELVVHYQPLSVKTLIVLDIEEWYLA